MDSNLKTRAGSTFVNGALQCVRHLNEDGMTPDEIFHDPLNTTIASSLTMMAHTSNYVSNLVAKNFDGTLRMAIIAEVEKEGDAKEVIAVWNEISRSEEKNRLRTESNPATQVHQRAVKDKVMKDAGRNIGKGSSGNTDEKESTAPVNRVVTVPYQKQVIRIPEEVSKLCMLLLLEGSGFFTHRTFLQELKYSNICNRYLIAVVKTVFEAEKKSRQEAQCDVLMPKTSSRNSLKGCKMIYSDLLPKNLRDEEQSFVVLPIVKLSFRGSVTKCEELKVSMAIRKPDRNRKSQNFALLCLLLYTMGDRSNCRRTLIRFAQDGVSSRGCERRKENSSSSYTQCGGPSACHELQKQVITILGKEGSERKEMAKGLTFHPCHVYNGKQVPADSCVVRVTSLVSEEEAKGLKPPWLIDAKLRPIVLQRDLIKRVSVLGDQYQEIGTAIISELSLPQELIQKLDEKGKRDKDGRGHEKDLGKAVVIFDLKLNEQITKLRYAHREWYTSPSIRSLLHIHFKRAEAPHFISAKDLKDIDSLLWHRDFIK